MIVDLALVYLKEDDRRVVAELFVKDTRRLVLELAPLFKIEDLPLSSKACSADGIRLTRVLGWTPH